MPPLSLMSGVWVDSVSVAASDRFWVNYRSRISSGGAGSLVFAQSLVVAGEKDQGLALEVW